MFKKTSAVLATIAAGSLALFNTAAQAALDAAVTTEIATAKTDVLALGALVFGVVIAVAVYKWFRRAV